MTRAVTTRTADSGRPFVRVAAVAASVGLLLAAVALPAVADAAPSGVGRAQLVVTGTVERMQIDDFSAPVQGEDHLTYVRTAAGAIQVPTSTLDSVPQGATVRVGLAESATARISGGSVQALTAGVVSDPEPEAGASVTGVEVLAQPAATVDAATATHSVLVVVATPAGGSASSVSAADVAATINGKVATYWSTVTDGAVAFHATAYGSVVTTSTTPCSGGNVGGSFDFWNEIKAKTGFVDGPGKHLVVYFKTLSACGGIAGLGTIGSGMSSGGVLWSNGFNTTGVLGHELGHNLSLGHSQVLDCTVGGSRVMDAATSDCQKRSYADSNDIMAVSWQNQGYLNASHLRRLGLLDASADPEPTDNGEVSLSPLASGTGTRALTLSDGDTHYVVEFRQAVGLDTWMATNPGWGSIGVTVRKEFDQAATGGAFPLRESYLLDGDPATSDAGFGNLETTVPVGVWINLDGGALGLRVTSISADAAVVEYRNGPASADLRYVAPPLPVVSTPYAWLRSGAITRTSAGPVIPVGWSWRVTTPSSDPSAAASVDAVKSLRTGRTALSGYRIGYRAYATAVDGTVVSTPGYATSVYRSETKTRNVAYFGTWKAITTSTAQGGTVRRTSVKGSRVTIHVTGRSVGLLLQRGTRNHYAAVYVDGVRVATLNLRASSTSTRLAWTKTFSKAGTHTVTVKNLSGGSYGRLGFDGYVWLA